MPVDLWERAQRTQPALTPGGDHRRVSPADLLLAATAEAAGVALVHYDRHYERIAAASGLRHEWLVPDGTLA
jgi:predicted nucleic acid-binding protein